MEDARLDHLMLRIENIERVLGIPDEGSPADGTSVLARLKEAEGDICALEVHRDNRESDETWAVVRKLVAHRDGNAGYDHGPLLLGLEEVRALADLIEGEWGKQ